MLFEIGIYKMQLQMAWVMFLFKIQALLYSKKLFF